jgi:colanic acid/amylovoran biosynthesis glycosyltransferase
LITIGRLDKVRGHVYCIGWRQLLTEKGVDLSLTIIGSAERFNLENLIVQYGLQEKKDACTVVNHNSKAGLWEHDVCYLQR